MADQSYCLSCGAQLIENAEFCGSCGRRRGQAGPPVSGGKSSSALLMAVMGSLGLVAVGGYAAKNYFGRRPVATTPAVASATPTATPTATISETASATPSPTPETAVNRWAGTWSGDPDAKGDRITVVIEVGDLPVKGHYAVVMKNGCEFRRGDLTFNLNAKHPDTTVDGVNDGDVYARVGVENGDMYGWVQVLRLTLKAEGKLKSSDSEEPDFEHFHRVGDPNPYVSLISPYGVQEYRDAASLGTRTTQVSRTGGGKLAMRTYSYMTNGTVNELRKYYKQEVPGLQVLDDEKDYCLAQIPGQGDAVTIEIIDNGDFRRVDLSKPKH